MIHIIQLLCPQRHCIAALPYDPATRSGESVVLLMIDQIAALRLSPWCGICGSLNLQYEDSETKFEIIQDCWAAMLVEQQKNLLTRQRLARDPIRN